MPQIDARVVKDAVTNEPLYYICVKCLSEIEKKAIKNTESYLAYRQAKNHISYSQFAAKEK